MIKIQVGHYHNEYCRIRGDKTNRKDLTDRYEKGEERKRREAVSSTRAGGNDSRQAIKDESLPQGFIRANALPAKDEIEAISDPDRIIVLILQRSL